MRTARTASLASAWQAAQATEARGAWWLRAGEGAEPGEGRELRDQE